MLPTKYASFIKRFVALVVDVVIIKTLAVLIIIPLGLLTAGTGALAGLSLQNFHQYGYYGDIEDVIEAFVAGLPIAVIIFWVLIYTFILWFYFAVFESSPRQATPGKMMLGLFVTDEHGRRISFVRALGRVVSKVLSKLFCGLGYIIALFTARSQALHDLIAGTLVLEPAYPAPHAATAPPQAVPPGRAHSPGPEGASVPDEQQTEPPVAIDPPMDSAEVKQDGGPEDKPAVDDSSEQEKK